MTAAAAIEKKPEIAHDPANQQDWASVDLSGVSLREAAGKTASTTGAALLDWGGQVAEGIDAVLNIPKKLFGLLSYIPVPGSDLVGQTIGTIASAIASFSVHTPTFGVLKWLKCMRREVAVSGSVNEGVAPDQDIDSVTVKSFLTTISDRKLRDDLKEYFVLSKSLGTVNADSALDEAQKKERTEQINNGLARLELILSKRAELNELKELASLDKNHQIASEARLTQLAETMADKMIKMVETHYKDRLGMLGSEVSGDWASLASKGQEGRPLLVRHLEERLLEAYLKERNSESTKETVGEIKSELRSAFMVSSTLREAVFYTVLPIVLYGPAMLNIDIGKLMVDTGKEVAEWLGNLAPHLVPQFVKDALAFAGQAAQTVWDGLLWIGGGWLGLKGVETARSMFGGDGSHPVDATHPIDGTHTVDATHPIDGVRTVDGTHVDTTSARPADGSGLLDSVRAQADVTADTSARLDPTRAVDPAAAVRSPIDTGAARGVDTVHPPHPHADVRAGDLQGRPVDPSVRVETIKVNPR